MIFLLCSILSKVVIVDDIGLSKEQLENLRNIKGLLPKKEENPLNIAPNSERKNFDFPNDYGNNNSNSMPKNENISNNFDPIIPIKLNKPYIDKLDDKKPSFNIDQFLKSNADDENDLVRQEKENIADANRARSAFIDLKLTESNQRDSTYQKRLYELEISHNLIEQKLKERKNEKEKILMNLMSLKNRRVNLINHKRKSEVEYDKLEATLRLLNNEITELNKTLDDLRSKALLTRDEKEVYENQLKANGIEFSKTSKEISSEEIKLVEYEKEVNELDGIYGRIKSQIDEMLMKRTKEETVRNRLDMEKERILRNTMALT